jgi:hypothetical protein
MARTITQVNFTFALPDGLWLKFDDGSSTWSHYTAIIKAHGKAEYDRLKKIAYANGMTGMWYNARNGGNVYANGQEVNA